MKQTLPPFLLFLLSALLLAIPGQAQNISPELNCEVQDSIGKNVVMCWVDWECDTNFHETCFSACPPGFSAGDTLCIDEIEPRSERYPDWKYFWEFGDGHYLRAEGRADTVFHTYTREHSEAFQVSLSLTPIYSPTGRPPRRSAFTPIDTIEVIPDEPNTNFSELDSLEEIKVEPHWDAATPGDSVLFAVSLRNLTAEASRDGYVCLAFPSDKVRMKDSWGLDLPGAVSRNLSDGDSVYCWSFRDMPQGDEKTFFMEVELQNFSTEDTAREQLLYEYGLLWEDQEGRSTSLGCLLGLDQLQQQSSGILPGLGQQNSNNTQGLGTKEQGDLPTVSEEKQLPEPPIALQQEVTTTTINESTCGTVENPDIMGALFTKTNSIAVNHSRDPNDILVDKRWLPPGAENVALTYRTRFQNLGTAPAEIISIQQALDAVWHIPNGNANSYELQLSNLSQYEINQRTNWRQDRLNNNVSIWLIEPNDVNGFASVLASPVDDPSPDSVGTKGAISYTLFTKLNKPLELGDSIVSFSDIIMDGVPLKTNLAVTRVREPGKFALPWYIGLKAGINNQSSTGLFGGFEGLHGGLTFRKGLQKLEYSHRPRPRISFSELPEWWYQAELMGSWHRFSDSIGLDREVIALDIVPLQVRYVPKPLRRLVAVSGGINSSIALSSKIEGKSVSYDGFFDRFDFFGFFDLAVLNTLGSPGLSLGFRYNWLLGDSEIYDSNNDLLQLYLHYNF